MRDLFQEAVRLIISQATNPDEQGFCRIHESFFEALKMEYEAHCRKHGIRVKTRAPRSKPVSRDSEARPA